LAPQAHQMHAENVGNGTVDLPAGTIAALYYQSLA
jgi:hypothetical protein